MAEDIQKHRNIIDQSMHFHFTTNYTDNITNILNCISTLNLAKDVPLITNFQKQFHILFIDYSFDRNFSF